MARVDLPEDSGPYNSTMRPRGRPPMPSAMSRASAPVGIDSMFMCRFSPMRMIEPLPNCFSIWPSAASRALARSSVAITVSLFFVTRAHYVPLVTSVGLHPLSRYYEQVFVTRISNRFHAEPSTGNLPGFSLANSLLINQGLIDQLLQFAPQRISPRGYQLREETH